MSKGRAAAAGILIVLLGLGVLAVDQFTKHLALDGLPYQEVVPIWGDFLQFYLTNNPGAAFSLGESVTWLFTIVLAAAAVTILVLAFRVRSWWWATILGLLLGGILGNLTDRLIRDPGFLVGHVVDFIYTPWMMPAIYNVADMFIVTMMISVAILVLIGLRFDGTRVPRSSESAEEKVEEPAADDITSAPEDTSDVAPAETDATRTARDD